MESKQTPGHTPAPTEKDALRTQAAALVAQQAALAEQEIKLRQDQMALEQHRSELAAHLDEKRRRILELQERTRKDHALLLERRSAYERHVAETTRALALTENEVADSRKQMQLDRRRLQALRQRLKQRWHRQWFAERAAWQHRQEELTRREQQLELEKERFLKERAESEQSWMRRNSEIELGGRELQDSREELLKSQKTLQQREADLAEREAKLVAEKRHWEQTLPSLAKEAEGLENRTRHQRLKLAELEQTVAGQERKASGGAFFPSPGLKAWAREKRATGPDLQTAFLASQSTAIGGQLSEETQERITHLRAWEAGLDQYWVALEKSAGDLADQRLHLAEQCERLALAEKRCHEDREAARERQQAVEGILRSRQQEMEKISAALRQQQEAVAQTQTYLEAIQARLTARTVACEGKRQCWTIQLCSREELVERMLIIISELHGQWRERHRQECEQIRTQREELQGARRDLGAHRDLWLQRCEELEREKRALLRRLLSLDKDRSVPQKKSQRLAGKKLFLKWGRRFAVLSTTLERTLVQEREALRSEAAILEERFAQLQMQSEKIAERETDLASREIAHEHSRMLAEPANARMRQELQTLNDLREAYERQMVELKEEVERLAGLLLKEDDAITLPVSKAA
jgi:hypothetical protein